MESHITEFGDEWWELPPGIITHPVHVQDSGSDDYDIDSPRIHIRKYGPKNLCANGEEYYYFRD